MTRISVRALAGAPSLIALAVTLAPAGATAEDRLDTVEVKAERVLDPSVSIIDPRAVDRPPAAEAGDLLRDLPGVDAVRMGGHGLDPVIRGQSQTQLNVYVDDAMIHGGCPNRMDPPTSYAAPESFDSVTVLRGYQSVRHGSGGTGGTVLFERRPVPFADGEHLLGKAGASFESNGVIRGSWADAAVGQSDVQLRAFGMAKKAENYTDGAGRKVRSAFGQTGGGLTGAWAPAPGSAVTMGVEHDYTEDALYAGASMDAPKSTATVWRTGFDHKLATAGTLRSVEGRAYYSAVDHLMDNYSLRSQTAAMSMKAPTESDTAGGRFNAELALAGSRVDVGADVQHLERSARRYRGTTNTNATTLQSVLWPDATISQAGVYAEATTPVRTDLTMITGLRLDHVQATTDAADRVASVTGALSRSANQLYRAYYGRSAGSESELNLSALARLQWKLSAETSVFSGLSRSMRTADTTERFIASDNGVASSRWVGNPGLEPEQHYQWDAGASTRGKDWTLASTVFVDRVHDHILRTVAADQATIYVNSEALLAGAEAEGRMRLYDKLWGGLGLGYTWGENLSSDRALAQIPPFQGSLSLTWEEETWSLGTRLRGAAKQGRIDPVSGQDADETAGWMVQDLFASANFGVWDLGVGVSNLFDADYTRHLNKASTFDPTVTQVAEPGRSFYMTATARF